MKRNFLLMLLLTFLPVAGWATDVSTADQLSAAFAAGGDVKLTDNIELSAIVKITKPVTLDLNGYKITVASTVTLEEPFIVKRGGKFTVTDNSTNKDGEIDASNCSLAIKMTEIADADDNTETAELVVEAGTIKGNSYAISGNGNPGRDNTSVTIKGGNIIATSETDGTAIYNPQDGTVIIEGGVITGYNAAVEVRSGNVKVKITAGTLTALAGSYSSTPNGDGITAVGAAFAVAQHTTKKDIDVEISGGTFVGARSLAIENPQGNTDANVEVSVTGGNFNGPVVVNDGRVGKPFKGGKYTDEGVANYVADGFYVKPIDENPYNYEVTGVDWKLSQSSLTYNADDQMSILGALIKLLPEGTEKPFTFTVKKGENANGTPVDEVKNVGSYFVQVYMGEGANKVEIGTGKIFKITAFTLTIGPSVTYKQIGDPDPAPDYGLMYDNNSSASTEAASLIITGLKLTRKYAAELGRIPTLEDDYVGAAWDFFLEINNAKIVDANGEVNPNYFLSMASPEGTLVVTKKLLRPDEFKVEVDAEYTYDGLEKKPDASAITVKQDKNYDKRGTEDYVADWQTVKLDGNFEIDSYANNIAADAYGTNSGTDAAPEYAWMVNVDEANRAAVILKPSESGIYTSKLELGNNVTLPANEEDEVKQLVGNFKIKQRDINTATVAEIADVIFKDAAFTPEPAVTYDNGTEAGLTLVQGTDFTYAYDKNTYVGDATVTIEAKYETTGEGEAATKTYTGNWFDKQDATFAIAPFEFTLTPSDNEKTLGDEDPDPLSILIGVPAAKMVDGDTKLPLPVTDVTTLLKDGWTISRASGEFVAVYDINVTGAELKASDPAVDSDPAHNYVMTVGEGTFEIKLASDYYVSSKYVSREFKSLDSSIPFIDEDNNTDGNAFYLYKRIVNGGRVTFEEIPETSDLYKEVKNSGRVTGNQLVGQTIDGSVQTVLNNNNIEPIIDNGTEGQYEYQLARLPRNAFQHTTGDYADTPEGICFIIPRKVTIMADNQTSAFGEPYVTPLTYKVYDGHVTRDDVTAETPVSNVQLTSATQYGPNTIAYFNGLTCGIQAAVNAAPKPLTANVTSDIVVSTAPSQGNQNLIQRNPNYDIKIVNGVYTVTPSTNQYFVDVELEKDYGTSNWEKTVTWTFGTSKETATAIEGDKPIPDTEIGVDWGQDGEPTEVGTTELTSTMITRPDGGDVINGYPVNYGGTAIVNKGGDVVIAVKTLGANYPVDPSLAFVAKRVNITGATFDEIDAFGDFTLAYDKPQVGFIAKGATLQVEFNGKRYGTAAGEVVSADDWAWVANYNSVTVKSGDVKVTAPDNITIDIVAFQKANYLAAFDADAEINDELIRDYAGTEVKSVTVKCSQQGSEAEEASQYTIKGNQWYSMILPFEATVREIQSLFNGFVGVERLNGTKGATKASEILFTYTTVDVPANTPFIAKTDKNFVFAPVTISRGDDKIMIEYPENEDGTAGELAVEDANGNKFVGTYNAFFADNQDDYSFLNISRGLIQAMGEDAYVRPLGAYIKVAPGVPNNQVRVFIEEADGTITAINGVGADVTVDGEGIYNLSGQRVNKAQKGIYIQNSKKVLVK